VKLNNTLNQELRESMNHKGSFWGRYLIATEHYGMVLRRLAFLYYWCVRGFII